MIYEVNIFVLVFFDVTHVIKRLNYPFCLLFH